MAWGLSKTENNSGRFLPRSRHRIPMQRNSFWQNFHPAKNTKALVLFQFVTRKSREKIEFTRDCSGGSNICDKRTDCIFPIIHLLWLSWLLLVAIAEPKTRYYELMMEQVSERVWSVEMKQPGFFSTGYYCCSVCFTSLTLSILQCLVVPGAFLSRAKLNFRI